MPILKQALKKIALCAAIAALSVSAHATTYVFDTGAANTSGGQTSLGNFFDSIESSFFYQGVAASFSIGSNTTIGSIEAYLGVSSWIYDQGKVDFLLRKGSGDWSGALEASGTVIVGADAGWYGLTGLSKAVAAGTYTLFLLPQADSIVDAYEGAPNIPNSLSDTWYFLGDHVLRSTPQYTYGIRVGAADPTPVPAPLPILGAVAAIGWSRKLRRRIRDSQALAA